MFKKKPVEEKVLSKLDEKSLIKKKLQQLEEKEDELKERLEHL